MTWPMVALGDVVEIKGGGTPDKKNPAYWGGDIPWASVKDFKSTELSATQDFITADGVANSATQVIPSGNIIVPTRMAVGKAAINSIDLAINQDLKALFPKVDIEQRYLLNVLLASSRRLEDQAKGATVKGIKLDVLRTLEIPLPPKNEQNRIAAILDQADALRRLRQRALDKLNTLGQSIFHEMFGEQSEDLVPLSQLFLKIQIGPFGSLLHKSDYVDGGVPVINPMHIVDGEIRPDSRFSVSEQKAETLSKYRLFPGDIVLGRRGEMGRCGVVEKNSGGCLCGTGSLILRPNQQKIDPYFAADLIRSPNVVNQIEKVARGVTMANLNSKSLNSVMVPEASRSKQDIYFRRTQKIRVQQELYVKSTLQLEKIFSSLQQRAFRGEL